MFRQVNRLQSIVNLVTLYASITFNNNFQPQGCCSPLGLSSATIAAGMQMGEIYSAVAQQNLTVVGGDVPTVGIIGLLTGVGYGPLSSTYGLAADAAPALDIVTAHGKLLTVNECQHTDLFFALRGVIALCATLPAYLANKRVFLGQCRDIWSGYFCHSPDLPNFEYYDACLNHQCNGRLRGLWDTTALIHSNHPRLADGGLSGQYFILPNSSSAAGAMVLGSQAASLQLGPGRGIISWALNIMNQPAVAANRPVNPLLQQLKSPHGAPKFTLRRRLESSKISAVTRTSSMACK